MRTLTVTAEGPGHLAQGRAGAPGRPSRGEDCRRTSCPGGRIEVKAVRPTGKISDAFGFLKAKRKGRSLSTDETNENVARGWAGKRRESPRTRVCWRRTAWHLEGSRYALHQLHHRSRKRLGRLLRHVVADATGTMRCERGPVNLAAGAASDGSRAHAVVGAVQCDGRHADGRLLGQPALQLGILRIASARPKRCR